jgi:hypothetical protein
MKAYISCPIPVPKSTRSFVAVKLEGLGYSPTWWERSKPYTEDKLKEADIFVLMSIDHKFDYFLDNMTFGCRKELALAKAFNKPLYMAYWKNDKKLNLYPISLKHLEKGRALGGSGSYPGGVSRVINNYQIF